jgi:hypothetical protein
MFSLLPWSWLRSVVDAHRGALDQLPFRPIQVFTGQVPFHLNLPPAAMLAILDGKRPPRPTHPQCTVELWKSMKTCWDQDPLRRPEISTVSKTFRSSSVFFLSQDRVLTYLTPRGSPSFSSDWASDVSTLYMLPESTDSESTESLESPKLPLSNKDHEPISGTDQPQPASPGEIPGPDQSGITQGPDNSQAATRNVTSGETTSHHIEVQGGKSTILTNLSPLRRGTDQSEQTPLPIDPPQFDSDQRIPKEYLDGPHADGSSSRKPLFY